MQAHPIPTTHETCNWYPYRSSGELVPPDARMIPPPEVFDRVIGGAAEVGEVVKFADDCVRFILAVDCVRFKLLAEAFPTLVKGRRNPPPKTFGRGGAG